MMKSHIYNHITRLRISSFLLLMLERLTAALWRPAIWGLFCGGVWLFEIPVQFWNIAEIVFLAIFISGLVYLFYKDTTGFEFPNTQDIDRRIEKDNRVRNRPLSGLEDSLANAHKRDTRSLWSLAQARLMAVLPHLKPAKLRAFLAARDPYAVRFGVLMGFVLGLVAAGPEWESRIWRGLTPLSPVTAQTAQRDHYTLWITPPEYTRLPQMVLNEKTVAGEPLQIAQGSTLKAIVHGGWNTPRLSIGDQAWDLKDGGERSFGIDVEIPQNGTEITLRQGLFNLASWPFEIIPDAPPTLEMTTEGPEELENASLRFAFKVHDDYGTEYLQMRMRLGDIVTDAPLGEPAEERRSILSPPAQDFEIAPVYDLTAHTWAGLPVVFEFTAIDADGQESKIVSQNLILPEREFQHPVAKTLIALRKKLAWQPESADLYAEVEYDLQILLTAKEMLHNDVVAYLGIRSAASRLDYNAPSQQIAREIMALMWDTALRVEDGDLSLSSRRLRDAQLALEEALQNPDLSEEEIAERMRELRQAFAEYFNELARELQKRAENGEQFQAIPPELLAQSLNPEAFADFLNQLEQNLRDGEMGSAQDMLSQMQRLLDMLNPGAPGQMPQDMQMMSEGINELEELIKRQEELLAQTREQAKLLDMLGGLGLDYGQSLPRNDGLLEEWGLNDLPPAPSAPEEPKRQAPFVNTQENRAEQEALRIILGQLMLDANNALGEIPEGMGLAEVEMRGSSEELGLNRPDQSIPHQELAIEYLKQAQEDLAEQLQQRMQQMTGFMLSMGLPNGGLQYDPLGRPMGEGENDGRGLGSDVKIPDEAERKRVEEILKLLRRRAGELDRPREEIEYYRRLLKRF